MIIDQNMLTVLLCDLNKEINYQLSEKEPCLFNEAGGDYLQLSNDGSDIKIYFLGSLLYSSKMEKELENIPVEKQLDLNEREKFELHIRILIMDKINFIKDLAV